MSDDEEVEHYQSEDDEECPQLARACPLCAADSTAPCDHGWRERVIALPDGSPQYMGGLSYGPRSDPFQHYDIYASHPEEARARQSQWHTPYPALCGRPPPVQSFGNLIVPDEDASTITNPALCSSDEMAELKQRLRAPSCVYSRLERGDSDGAPFVYKDIYVTRSYAPFIIRPYALTVDRVDDISRSGGVNNKI